MRSSPQVSPYDPSLGGCAHPTPEIRLLLRIVLQRFFDVEGAVAASRQSAAVEPTNILRDSSTGVVASLCSQTGVITSEEESKVRHMAPTGCPFDIPVYVGGARLAAPRQQSAEAMELPAAVVAEGVTNGAPETCGWGKRSV